MATPACRNDQSFREDVPTRGRSNSSNIASPRAMIMLALREKNKLRMPAKLNGCIAELS
jgi:hypothetical protein